MAGVEKREKMFFFIQRNVSKPPSVPKQFSSVQRSVAAGGEKKKKKKKKKKKTSEKWKWKKVAKFDKENLESKVNRDGGRERENYNATCCCCCFRLV